MLEVIVVVKYSRCKNPSYSSVTVEHKEKANKNVINSIEYTQWARAASTVSMSPLQQSSTGKSAFDTDPEHDSTNWVHSLYLFILTNVPEI